MTERRFKASALLIVTTTAAAAYGADAPWADPATRHQPESHVQVRLVSETTAIQPQARMVVGVHFKIEPGWHIYWDGLNDTGQAPIIKLDLPDGFTQTPVMWPAPKRHVARGDILDHIYEDSVTLIIGVTPPATIKPGSEVTFKVNADWLVCSDVCVPEDGGAELTLPVKPSGAQPPLSTDAALFAPARASMPEAWSAAPKHASLEWKDRVLMITSLTGPRIEFYPGPHSSSPINPVKAAASDNGKLALRFNPGEDGRIRAEGVVAIWSKPGAKPSYYTLDTQSPASDDTAKPGP